jgi:uncharacterized SAM-binding protein YcdF (DUF218 family)
MTRFLDPAALLWLVLLMTGFTLLLKKRRAAGLLLVTGCVGWWVAEFTALPARLLAGLERPYVGSAPGTGEVYDAIVVLGGGTGYSTNEFAGLNFGEAADRVLTAVELAREGRGGHLVLGGSSRQMPELAPEPELLRKWIERWDLTRTPLSTLGYCRNTRDEAVRMEELARENGWRRILLVTSASHLKRAEATFRAVGLEVRPVGCDYVGTAVLRNRVKPVWVPQLGSMVLWENWLHEVVGMQYYRFRGWIRD